MASTSASRMREIQDPLYSPLWQLATTTKPQQSIIQLSQKHGWLLGLPIHSADEVRRYCSLEIPLQTGQL